jgi:hypothetical protein
MLIYFTPGVSEKDSYVPKSMLVLFQIRRMIEKVIQLWHFNFLATDSNAATR